jgi:uncharacterized protein
MLFYVLTIVRIAHTPAGSRWFSGIACAGRMPLTNYIGQSINATTIFYGWGFGLWGKIGPFWQLLIAPAIFFVIQVPLSRWWLKSHEQGPLEWLWRRLTYRRAPV